MWSWVGRRNYVDVIDNHQDGIGQGSKLTSCSRNVLNKKHEFYNIYGKATGYMKIRYSTPYYILKYEV